MINVQSFKKKLYYNRLTLKPITLNSSHFRVCGMLLILWLTRVHNFDFTYSVIYKNQEIKRKHLFISLFFLPLPKWITLLYTVEQLHKKTCFFLISVTSVFTFECRGFALNTESTENYLGQNSTKGFLVRRPSRSTNL